MLQKVFRALAVCNSESIIIPHELVFFDILSDGKEVAPYDSYRI